MVTNAEATIALTLEGFIEDAHARLTAIVRMGDFINQAFEKADKWDAMPADPAAAPTALTYDDLPALEGNAGMVGLRGLRGMLGAIDSASDADIRLHVLRLEARHAHRRYMQQTIESAQARGSWPLYLYAWSVYAWLERMGMSQVRVVKVKEVAQAATGARAVAVIAMIDQLDIEGIIPSDWYGKLVDAMRKIEAARAARAGLFVTLAGKIPLPPIPDGCDCGS